MSKYILELEDNLECSASFHDGILTLEDGTQTELMEVETEDKREKTPLFQELSIGNVIDNTMMSKVAWISIKVTLNDDADLDEVVQEMDYKLEHDDIIDTEVMEIAQ
jgi:hypothetical protein